MARYFYIDDQGGVRDSGDVRIDPPDNMHPDYVDGNLSMYWSNDWYRRIDGEASGYPEEGQAYNLDNSLWYYPKHYLHILSVTKRNSIINSGVEYDGKDFDTNDATSTILGVVAAMARFEDKESMRSMVYNYEEMPVSYTNEQYILAVDNLINFRQGVIDAEVKIHEDIENNDVETPSEIDDAFLSYMTDPIERDSVTDLFGVLQSKVDKETGKGLSKNDFTDALKDKLDGIVSGATANDTDANLLKRENHTGEQAISTITDLGGALTSLSNRLDTLEAWKAVMPKKQVRFTGTTDANGDVTINLTSGGFTNIPAIAVTYIFNNNNYGTHFNIKALSATSIQMRVMRNKNTTVGALGGDVDPDEPLASTAIVLIATEF